MFVGIGAGALVLVIIIAVVASSGGSAPKESGTVVATDNSGDGLLQQGRKLLAKAQNMPATPARNSVYRQAASVLMQAKKEFERSGQHNKVIEANKYAFDARKSITK